MNIENMNVEDLFEHLDATVESFIATNMNKVSPEQLGLDSRAGYFIYANQDGIAVNNNSVSQFDYYGGMEYVERDARHEFGNWTFYSNVDDRVAKCIKHLNGDLTSFQR